MSLPRSAARIRKSNLRGIILAFAGVGLVGAILILQQTAVDPAQTKSQVLSSGGACYRQNTANRNAVICIEANDPNACRNYVTTAEIEASSSVKVPRPIDLPPYTFVENQSCQPTNGLCLIKAMASQPFSFTPVRKPQFMSRHTFDRRGYQAQKLGMAANLKTDYCHRLLRGQPLPPAYNKDFTIRMPGKPWSEVIIKGDKNEVTWSMPENQCPCPPGSERIVHEWSIDDVTISDPNRDAYGRNSLDSGRVVVKCAALVECVPNSPSPPPEK